MSRPLSVFRWAAMLSMVFALMSAFTVNVGAQAADEILVTTTNAAGDTLTCTVAGAGFTDPVTGNPAPLAGGEPLVGEAVDAGGTTVAAGNAVFDPAGTVLTLAPVAGQDPAAGNSVIIEATDAAGNVIAVNNCDLVGPAAVPAVIDILKVGDDPAATPLEGAVFEATSDAGEVEVATTGPDGTAQLVNFEVGDVVTICEVVAPEGFDPAPECQVVPVDEANEFVQFVNTAQAPPPPVVETSTVSIQALFCENEGLAGTVEFFFQEETVAPADCVAAAGVTFFFDNQVDDVGTGDVVAVTDANGFAVVELVAGTYTVTTDAGAGAIDIVVDGVNDYALTAVAYIQPAVVPEPGVGFVDVEKLVCTETADDPAGDVDMFVPGEFVAAEAPAECRAATEGEFTFTLFNNDLGYEGGEIVAIDNVATDATGQAVLTAEIDPALGTRTVFVAEDVTGVESIDIVLADGDVAEVLVINYVADLGEAVITGDVEIAKLYCLDEALAGGVEFEVLGPEFPVEATGVTGQAGVTQPDNCAPGAAEFELYPFGDKTAEPILITVGSDGLIVIDDLVPVTTDAEPHKLVEVSTGAETFFDVEEGAVTKIIVINYVGEGAGEQPGGEKPGGTTGGGTTTGGGATTGGGSATTLPDTGAGAGQSGAEYGMALFLVLGGLAAAGVSLRRRAA